MNTNTGEISLVTCHNNLEIEILILCSTQTIGQLQLFVTLYIPNGGSQTLWPLSAQSACSNYEDCVTGLQATIHHKAWQFIVVRLVTQSLLFEHFETQLHCESKESPWLKNQLTTSMIGARRLACTAWQSAAFA